MSKTISIIDLFRKGEAVADKEVWKKGAINATLVSGFVVAVVNTMQAYGVPIPAGITAEFVTMAVTGIIGVVNVVATYVTSETVGILPAKATEE